MLKDCTYGLFEHKTRKKLIMKGVPEELLRAIQEKKTDSFWLYKDGVVEEPDAYGYILGDYEAYEVMNMIAIPLGCNHIQFEDGHSLTRLPAQVH